MSDGEGNAELVLLSVRVNPESPQPGDQVAIIAEARNAGGVETGAFQARYQLESERGTVQGDVNWPSIYAGESHSEQWQVPLQLQAGDYHFSVQLDIYNQVNEQNKDDNSGSDYFQIGAPVSMQLPDEDQLSGKNVNVKPDEEEVVPTGSLPHVNIGAGNTVQVELLAQTQAMNQAISDYWGNFAAGLHDFEVNMAFPPDQEVEVDQAKDIITSLFKKVLDYGLDAAAEALEGPAGMAIKAAKTIVESSLDSSIPVKSHKEKIAEFLENAEDNMVKRKRDMEKAIDYHAFLSQYTSQTSDWPDKGAATPNGDILGPGAQFIINLRAAVERLQRSTPDIGQFQQQLTEAFSGMPVKSGGHYKVDGRLYIHLNLYNDGSKWEIRDGDKQWTLATSQPDAEGAAKSLHSALTKQGKRPWDAELPKEVEFFIEVEETGNNAYADGRLMFAGQNMEPNDVLTNYSQELFTKAWSQPDVQARVMQASDIIGKSL